MTTTIDSGIWFDLPVELEATTPPEHRGLTRDGIRLLVTDRAKNRHVHARMHDLAGMLDEGDALVVNVSRTLAAALPVEGTELRLHLSRRISDERWVVELRRAAGVGTEPMLDALAGTTLRLPGGASAKLLQAHDDRGDGRVRLWLAQLELPLRWGAYLDRFGEPIRYGYAAQQWPIEAYRTSYGVEPGSAEMPSAGRGLTAELLSELSARGIEIIPVTLHCGVASLEAWEGTQAEPYRVSDASARRINEVKASGGRVIAVGTTAVRAVESAADEHGLVHRHRRGHAPDHHRRNAAEGCGRLAHRLA